MRAPEPDAAPSRAPAHAGVHAARHVRGGGGRGDEGVRAPGLTRVRAGPRARHSGDADGEGRGGTQRSREGRAGRGDCRVGGGGAERRAGTRAGTRPPTAAPHPVPLRPSGPARGSHSSRIKAGSDRGSRNRLTQRFRSSPPGRGLEEGRRPGAGLGAGAAWSRGCRAVLHPAAPGCGPDRGLSRYLDHVSWRTPGCGCGWEAVQEQRSVQKGENYRLAEALHLSLVSVLQVEVPLITHEGNDLLVIQSLGTSPARCKVKERIS